MRKKLVIFLVLCVGVGLLHQVKVKLFGASSRVHSVHAHLPRH